MHPHPGPPVALISGAAGGIGRATVARLLSAGFHVVAFDSHEPGLKGAVDAWNAADRVSLYVGAVEEPASTLTGQPRAVFMVVANCSDAGRVISICCTAATTGQALMAHNVAAEAGVIAMLRGLAQELGPSGITTNAIVVGPIDRAASDPAAARIPAIRDGSAGDVPGAVLFLASDAPGWITGQCLHVNGGFIPE